MNKEMIVSSTPHETRVAILEDDLVAEIFVEREHQRGVVGNIYKGRVSKVLPGMQSAFVDIGLERDAFLYVTDVISPAEAVERFETDDEDEARDEPAVPDPADAAQAAQAAQADADDAEQAEAEAEADVTGDSGGAPAAPVGGRGRAQAAARPQNGGRRDPKERPAGRDRGGERDRDRPQAKIEELLKEGQEILVQIVKEPLGTKGARITSHLSLPGRFLVFMPTVDHVGVSRKIESREERGRLRGLVKSFRQEHDFGGGVIIRTAAASRPEADINSDLGYFHEIWKEIRVKMESSRAPAVIFREQSLVAKLLRDLLTEQYSAIRIDNEQEYRRVVALIERFMPAMLPRIKHYTRDFPIFEEYGVQGEIDKALRSKVWLKSGGYIVINQTEALVAIDVNTGRYVGKKTGRLEDTILKTNLEAAKEIVRQIRLRDLGGIIVLDLIDMEEKKNRQKVFQAVEQELRKDRAPSKAIQVSDFGLVIVTRKRVKQSLERQLTEPCPYCAGSGTIKATSMICYEILTEVRKMTPDLDGQGLVLRVNPDIARALREEERVLFRELQDAVGRSVTLKADGQLHHEQFDLMAL
ncbi:MAG TPA: Rne/Rng family ribonuclease [Vicinamibacterales bacterium]|nr:Rne/Rng family ribonuclease [Vicinamibacterales bacterium]